MVWRCTNGKAKPSRARHVTSPTSAIGCLVRQQPVWAGIYMGHSGLCRHQFPDDDDRDGSRNIGFYGHLTQLIVREDFIKFSHRKSYRSYTISIFRTETLVSTYESFTSLPRRTTSSSSPPWEPQISYFYNIFIIFIQKYVT
jgi:hypothetical protein